MRRALCCVAAVALGFGSSAAFGETVSATVAASPPLARFLPCTAGLSIDYRRSDPGARARIVDTVRGAGREPNSCVIDRVRTRADGHEAREAFAREMLPDRISYAGGAEQPLAFRPPLLKAPLEVGRHWHFDATRYSVRSVSETITVPAGTFSGCVRVDEQTSEGRFQGSSVYAPGVGLVLFEIEGGRYEAQRVVLPPKVGAEMKAGVGGSKKSAHGVLRGATSNPAPKPK